MADVDAIACRVVKITDNDGVLGMEPGIRGGLGAERGAGLPAGPSRHVYEDACLLIVGHCLLDLAARQAAFAAAVRSSDLGRVAAWPGAYSAIVIRPGAVTGYADPSEQFPLYYSQRGAEILVSADPSALATAHGRQPDPITAAAHIVCPGVLPLWQGRSHYAGVSRVPGGAVLRAAPGSIRTETSQMRPPVAGRSLDEGAALLRDALADAVRKRCEGRQVSADFSGGLDSTSVAFLAAACARPPVAAITYHQPLAPAADLEYAARYALLEPRLSLSVVAGTERMLPFAGLSPNLDADMTDGHYLGGSETEGSFAGLVCPVEPHPGWLVAQRSLARLAAARRIGSVTHLTGEGGDAILMSSPSYLATLARHGKIGTLLRHSGGYARLRQVAPASLVGQAFRLAVTTRGQALSSLAAELAGQKARADRWVDFVAWWPPAGTAAGWLSAQSRRQLSELAGDPATARAVSPGLSPADLAALTDLRQSGDAQRQLRQLAAPLGLEVHAPFLDSAVIRAALSVPAPVRANPWTYKPLLGAALAGLLPAEVLGRRTKGDYTAEDYAGARAALPGLRDLLRDSRLAALGVIEPRAVLAALDRMAAGAQVPLGPLNMLLATEMWLQSRENEPSEACVPC
jgi:asparagine synthase (glutamine-hydrolysing)